LIATFDQFCISQKSALFITPKKKHKMNISWENIHKFIRQKNNYSCGPVSLFNLCQFYGVPFDYSFIYKLCKCNKKSGTTTKNFALALNFILKHLRYDNRKSLKCYPCTLVEYPIENVTHFALIIDNYIINKDGKDSMKPIVQKMTQRFLQHLANHASVWTIRENCRVTVMK
jgi:hypothetical protein